MTVELAVLLFAAMPLALIFVAVLLRRALHVFQLEGYKRDRFFAYEAPSRMRALHLVAAPGKKPLVMTGRARRIYGASILVATVFAYGLVLLVNDLTSDATAIAAFALAALLLVFFTDSVLVAGDILVFPVQRRINERFLAAASRKLDEVSPLVVGITGSFGKTSTKFAVAGLLGPANEVLATPGSFNTPLGVCRTINEEMHEGHRYFVVEMGAYREGDVAELCGFVRPSIGVLTAIGPMHLDRFGSVEAIRRAKYEIVTSLPADGVAVMNVDDPEVRALADKTTGVTVVRYGIDPEGRPDVAAGPVEITPAGMSLTIIDHRSGERAQASTHLLGRHAAGHVLAGVASAIAAGRSLSDLPSAIALLEPVEHRLQLIEGAGGVTVIDDAFNSNPDGAAVALEVLEQMPAGKRLVVTPGIVELGEMQYEANRAFGEAAAKAADVVILVGRLNRPALTKGAAGGPAQVVAVDSLAEATRRLAGMIGAGDVVLFENDLPDQYEG